MLSATCLTGQLRNVFSTIQRAKTMATENLPRANWAGVEMPDCLQTIVSNLLLIPHGGVGWVPMEVALFVGFFLAWAEGQAVKLCNQDRYNL